MTDLSSQMKILGKPAFIEQPNILHNQRIGRVVFFDDSISPRFLYYFLRTRSVLEEIKSTATGTMVRHTSPTRILSSKVAFPVATAHQARIVAKLDVLQRSTSQLARGFETKMAALNGLRHSILRKAFTGELTAQPEQALREATA